MSIPPRGGTEGLLALLPVIPPPDARGNADPRFGVQRYRVERSCRARSPYDSRAVIFV